MTQSISKIGSILLAFLALCCTAYGADEAADVTETRTRILGTIKALADEGALDDAQATSRTLGFPLQTVTKTQVTNPACSPDGQGHTSWTTIGRAVGTVWYHALHYPENYPFIPVPSKPAQPSSLLSTGVDDPIVYYNTRMSFCTPGGAISSSQADIHTELTFYYLSTISCFTGDDLKQYFPSGHLQRNTDFVITFKYQGKIDDDAGTSVDFYMGGKCADFAVLRRDGNSGLRYARAVAKRRNCLIRMERDFCVGHETMFQDDIKSELSRLSENCPSEKLLMERDTEQGMQPEYVPTARRDGPVCNRY